MAGISGPVISFSSDTQKFEAGLKKIGLQTKEHMLLSEKAVSREKRFNEQRTGFLEKIEDAQKKLNAARESGASEEKLGKLQANLEKFYQQEKELIIRNEIALEQAVESRHKLIEKQANDAKKQAKGLEASLGGVVNMAKRFLPALGVAGVGAFLANTVSQLDSIAKRAKDVGLSSSGLYELHKQAKLLKVETSSLDSAFMEFKKNIGGAALGGETNAQSKAFERLGISIRDVNGNIKDLKTLSIEVSDAFNKTAGNAENAKIAQELFGRSGRDVLRILEQGGDALKKAYDSTAIDDAAKAAERFNATLSMGKDWAFQAGVSLIDAAQTFLDLSTDSALMMFHGGRFGDTAAKRAEDEYNATAAAAERQRITDADALATRKLENLKKVDELDAKLADGRLKASLKAQGIEIQILNTKNEISQIEKESLKHEQDSAEYAEIYEKIIDKTIELEAQQAALEASNLKTRLDSSKKVDDANKKRADAQLKELGLDGQILEARRNIEASMERINGLAVESAAYADEYSKLVDAKIKLAALQKAQADKTAAEAKMASAAAEKMSKAREEFEFQLKVDLLKKNGYERESKQLELIKQRNKLMEDYGYSIEQATKLTKALNAETNPKANYSKEDVAKAQKILDRGAGGSVGKNTLKEAQAIVSGETLEGGFKMAQFKDVKSQGPRSPQRPIGAGGLNIRIPEGQSAQASKGGKDEGGGKGGLLDKVTEILEELQGMKKELTSALSA